MALIFELCTAIPRWKRIVPWDEEYGLRDQETSKNAMIVETGHLLLDPDLIIIKVKAIFIPEQSAQNMFLYNELITDIRRQ